MNKFDKNGLCEIQGKLGESLFVSAATNLGLTVKEATKNENIYSHIDYWLDGKWAIDVKAQKKNTRYGQIDNKYIWVEFKGITGYPGWLYGKSDFIGFERESDFILVRRKELLAKVLELTDLVNFVEDPKDAIYKAFRRTSRPLEMTTRIESSILESLPHKILAKS